jgi:uncharacterized membrane protein YuzA (DUF378 family)
MELDAIFTRLATILVIIGAVNWGLVGLNGFDLVAKLFGNATTLSNLVYMLVGISGIFLVSRLNKLISAI